MYVLPLLLLFFVVQESTKNLGAPCEAQETLPRSAARLE